MAVTEEAINATISTTKAVIKKRPIKPCHMAFKEALVDTAKAMPAVASPSLDRAGTPKINRLPAYSPPRSSRWTQSPSSSTV